MIRTFSFYLLVALLFSANNLSAQDNGGQLLLANNKENFYSTKVSTDYHRILSPLFKNYQVVTLPSSLIASSLQGNNRDQLNIGLQINDQLAFNLQLQQNNILSNDYIVTTQTSGGKINKESHPAFFYKGKLANTDNGDVRLSIKDGFIYGYIRKEGKEYFIDPLNRYGKDLPKDEFVFYEAKDVAGFAISCGFNDLQGTMINIKNEQPGIINPTTSNGTLNTICRKVKFFISADFSMYQSFNRDLDALETFLLANLNMAEGLFNTLNLDSTIAGDVGADLLNFEVSQLHSSVCDSCDILSSADITTNEMAFYFAKWLDENTKPKRAFVYQYWSTRKLGIGSTSYLGFAVGYKNYPGCFTSYTNFIRYITQDPITLRLQISHEAGHAFGCPHDNEISPTVTGFIMNASGTYSPTGRFSRLSDFGGINYSSQQTINKTVAQSNCFEECISPVCEPVSGLKISYFNSSDSTKISWNGSGNFIVRYKIKEAVNYDTANQYMVAGNEIVLKYVVSCTNYIVEVQQICGGNNTGRITSIDFNSSPFGISASSINKRGKLYDLKLELECKNCGAKNVIINVDHQPYYFNVSQFPSTVTIPNLFADGARHRIDYNGDIVNSACTILKFYDAPYYRDNSIKIINENFDSCKISTEWKDSVFKAIASLGSRSWKVANYPGEFNVIHGYHYKGNFDSSCMLYDDYGVGISGLTSQPHDLTKFTDLYLSFDYKYLSFVYVDFGSIVKSSFKVQVYDGLIWQDVLELSDYITYVSQRKKLIWDTIPARVFIKLDKYISDKLRVRFVVDDGAILNPNTGTNYPRAIQLLYLDNIKIDGYEKQLNTGINSFSIFPNPANQDVFIRIHPLSIENIQYKLMDVLGRVLQQEKLLNYRINTSKLNSGIYFLALYNGNKQIGKTEKFIKN